MRVIAAPHTPEQPRVATNQDDPRLGIPKHTLIEEIVRRAELHGYHIERHRSQTGYPTLTLIRNRKIIHAEIKATNGRTSRIQHQWHRRLANANQLMFLWKPIDWLTGAIDTELRRP